MEKLMNDENFDRFFTQILKEEQINFIQEKVSSMSALEKELMFEYFKAVNPKIKNVLMEQRWWNTLGDWIGMADPSGTVNVVNGLDYLRQGDEIMGIVNLIVGVPVFGKFALPLLAEMKLGGSLLKALEAAKTSGQFAQVGKKFGLFGKILKYTGKIGAWLIKWVSKVPGLKWIAKIIDKFFGQKGFFTTASNETEKKPETADSTDTTQGKDGETSTDNKTTKSPDAITALFDAMLGPVKV
jgi:hypothetical protein